MMLVLQATMMIPAAMPVSQPRHTALQTMLAFIRRLESHLGPGRWPNDAACVVQATSMWEHWPGRLHIPFQDHHNWNQAWNNASTSTTSSGAALLEEI